MREFKFTVNSEEAGKRLDKVITDRLTGYSRSQVKKLFELGNVYVDHKDVSAGKQKVEEGMQVHLRIPQQENFEIRPENIPIDIVYEDEDVLVVNKPRGMVVHPAPGNYSGTLVNALLYYPGKEHLSDVNGDVRPGIVHRIDKDTSGLLMVAKNNEAHKSLAEQLYVHSIRRQYIALVQDNIKDDDGTIDAPIGRDRKNRMKRSVNGENPKRAVTHFHVLERFGFCTLIACQLETGRTHQIRVHMSSIKHPLVGDPMYGSRKTWKGQMAQLLSRMQGQLLHAQILGFNHPRTGKYMEFRAPLPEEFEKVLAYLREKR
ncbi:MAG: RluA family pseudouridine synthase [Eubacterium sp.]|jgi:23S rRNA pseudouridine1911/1915/1917 synthase